MKNTVKWIITAAVLAAVIVTATALYNKFSDDYKVENLMDAGQVKSTEKPTERHFAPDFTVLDNDGNAVKLSDFKGKPVVLNFWATWCYYCKVEMPDFNSAYKNYPDVQFMMVNATDGVQETLENAKEYITNEQFEFDVFYDTGLEAVNAYYVTGFPSTFFINKDGELITRGNGMLDYQTLEKGIKMITE